MKRLLVALLLLVSINAAAQDKNNIKFKPYGFVRNYISYDSRQCLNLMGETFNVMPLDEKLNDHAYIVPGLGDAGDLAFGEKI